MFRQKKTNHSILTGAGAEISTDGSLKVALMHIVYCAEKLSRDQTMMIIGIMSILERFLSV